MSALVLACAVCGSGEGDLSRGSYVWMSLIISALPILMLGGILAWVVSSARAAERKAADHSVRPELSRRAPRSEP